MTQGMSIGMMDLTLEDSWKAVLKLTRAATLLLGMMIACGSAFAEATGRFERFEGGYLGVQVGTGTAGVDFSIGHVSVLESESTGNSLGLFGGYGWQSGRRFWGVELSAGYSGVKNRNLSPVFGTPWVTGEIERVYAVNLMGRAG